MAALQDSQGSRALGWPPPLLSPCRGRLLGTAEQKKGSSLTINSCDKMCWREEKKQQKKGVSLCCLFVLETRTWHVCWLLSGSNARHWHSLSAVVNFKCNKITLQHLTHLWEQHHDTVDTECSLMASSAKPRCKTSGITTAAFKKLHSREHLKFYQV